MKKYFSISKISFQQEFAYKLNFVLWRVRNVLQIFIIFFLWDNVFSDPTRVVLGYDRAKILTYVFGTLFLRALVFSARSVDVPGEISEGTLTNYLLKPIDYFKYWAARDLSSKALNVLFSIVEFTILYFLLKPNLFLQTDALYLSAFLISLVFANYLIFVLRFIVNFVTFWVPELAWGAQFLFMIIIAEFLSGALFPLDILPTSFQQVINLTPFPYLIFFPLQVLLGNVSQAALVSGLLVCTFWSIILTLVMQLVWHRGLRIYKAEGR